jgi:hypothetical protein
VGCPGISEAVMNVFSGKRGNLFGVPTPSPFYLKKLFKTAA